MERVVRNILFNCCFAFNCLLLFFLIFESRMVVPAWLQVAGRMHPLLLHFPIVLLVVYIVWSLFLEKRSSDKRGAEWILLLSAFTASVTSLAGLFLSKEEGYDAEALLWHKWSGFVIAVITMSWYAFRNAIGRRSVARVSTAVVSLFVVLFTGHQGAAITHGENFLLAPVFDESEKPKILMEEAEVYAHMVKPIFDEKCMSCHNAKKAKGELVMETEAQLLKGGKNGKLWDSTAEGYGLLLGRLHLPEAEKKHMPPKGKPQLEEDEMEIISLWIQSGADFNTRVADLPDNNPLRAFAEKIFNTIENDDYDFAAADEQKIESLNSNYRVVVPLAKESPALSVKFFGAQFYKPEQLTELLDVKTQVVDLNLDKMPVKDAELKTISQFSNLRKLSLSFTPVTGNGLKELSKLDELRQISFSGTKVTKETLLGLTALKQLNRLYIWNTNLSEPDIATLKSAMKQVAIETGYASNADTLLLPPPMLVNNEPVQAMPFQVKLKHPVNGVSIRYTLDGSDPDSLESPEFTGNVSLSKTTRFKARAFKNGWYSSPVLENYFYAASYKPDSVTNLLPPDDLHKGNGAKTLTDQVKGDIDITGSDRWLGFRNNKMETMLSFAEGKKISNVIVATLVNVGGAIMPPAAIEIWAGNDKNHLTKISRFVPEQPTKYLPAELKPFEISFTPVEAKYIKVIAEPVAKLPTWHHSKGQKAWLLVDELFLNQ